MVYINSLQGAGEPRALEGLFRWLVGLEVKSRELHLHNDTDQGAQPCADTQIYNISTGVRKVIKTAVAPGCPPRFMKLTTGVRLVSRQH